MFSPIWRESMQCSIAVVYCLLEITLYVIIAEVNNEIDML